MIFLFPFSTCEVGVGGWKNSSLSYHPAHAKFHTYVFFPPPTTHLLICAALLFSTTPHPPLRSSCPPPAYEILPLSTTKDVANHLQAMAVTIFCEQFGPLKRKIAFNISCSWKTTTIKRYNCNAVASVSTWPGQLRDERMTGGWGAYKSAL